MVTQISAASPSPNYIKTYYKNNNVYFLAICLNFPCKVNKFELEVVNIGILGTGFCFQGSS